MESGLLHTLMARYEAEGVAPDGDIHRGEYPPKCWSKQKGGHQVATSIVESGEYNPECWSRVGAVRFCTKMSSAVQGRYKGAKLLKKS